MCEKAKQENVKTIKNVYPQNHMAKLTMQTPLASIATSRKKFGKIEEIANFTKQTAKK